MAGIKNQKHKDYIVFVFMLILGSLLRSFYSKVEGATKLKFAPFCSP